MVPGVPGVLNKIEVIIFVLKSSPNVHHRIGQLTFISPGDAKAKFNAVWVPPMMSKCQVAVLR